MRRANKRSSLFYLCMLVLVMGYHLVSQENKSELLAISTLLHPETESWVPLREMRRPGVEELRKLEPVFRKAYLERQINDLTEEAGPDFIKAALPTKQNADENWFFQFDVDGNGTDDVIYAGPRHYSEGHVTIIWLGEKETFSIKGYWDGLALRIQPGKDPKLSLVARGCCDMIWDEYYLSTLDTHHIRTGKRVILKRTPMPTVLIESMSFSSSFPEMVLRYSPEVNDEYDHSESDHWGNAIYGNVLARYLPGCTGTVVGQSSKSGKDLWYFVLLDDRCESLRTHGPYSKYGVNTGWVKATSIHLK